MLVAVAEEEEVLVLVVVVQPFWYFELARLQPVEATTCHNQEGTCPLETHPAKLAEELD